MKNLSVSDDRKFLHDLASPLTILKIVLKNLADLQAQSGPKMDKKKMAQLIQKAAEAAQKIEQLHEDHRINLASRESRAA
jgi:hypothetical protein